MADSMTQGLSEEVCDAERIQERLNSVRARNSNQHCADCMEPNPSWASILKPAIDDGRPMVVVCCSQCCTFHADLENPTCELKSLLEASDWTEDEVKALEASGNRVSNEVYEAKIAAMDDEAREEIQNARQGDMKTFVKEKYLDRLYFCEHAYRRSRDRLAKHKNRAKGLKSRSPCPPASRRKLQPRSYSAGDGNDRPGLQKTSSGKDMNRRRDGLKKVSSFRHVGDKPSARSPPRRAKSDLGDDCDDSNALLSGEVTSSTKEVGSHDVSCFEHEPAVKDHHRLPPRSKSTGEEKGRRLERTQSNQETGTRRPGLQNATSMRDLHVKSCIDKGSQHSECTHLSVKPASKAKGSDTALDPFQRKKKRSDSERPEKRHCQQSSISSGNKSPRDTLEKATWFRHTERRAERSPPRRVKSELSQDSRTSKTVTASVAKDKPDNAMLKRSNSTGQENGRALQEPPPGRTVGHARGTLKKATSLRHIGKNHEKDELCCTSGHSRATHLSLPAPLTHVGGQTRSDQQNSEATGTSGCNPRCEDMSSDLERKLNGLAQRGAEPSAQTDTVETINLSSTHSKEASSSSSEKENKNQKRSSKRKALRTKSASSKQKDHTPSPETSEETKRPKLGRSSSAGHERRTSDGKKQRLKGMSHADPVGQKILSSPSNHEEENGRPRTRVREENQRLSASSKGPEKRSSRQKAGRTHSRRDRGSEGLRRTESGSSANNGDTVAETKKDNAIAEASSKRSSLEKSSRHNCRTPPRGRRPGLGRSASCRNISEGQPEGFREKRFVRRGSFGQEENRLTTGRQEPRQRLREQPRRRNSVGCKVSPAPGPCTGEQLGGNRDNKLDRIAARRQGNRRFGRRCSATGAGQNIGRKDESDDDKRISEGSVEVNDILEAGRDGGVPTAEELGYGRDTEHECETENEDVSTEKEGKSKSWKKKLVKAGKKKLVKTGKKILGSNKGQTPADMPMAEAQTLGAKGA